MSGSRSGVIDTPEIPAAGRAGKRAKLDPQNPWPGLDAYREDSKDFFKGREEEAAELMRLIRLSTLTVVYGKSGLGKTSLLKAGLFPLLRAEHFLPVYLRLDFSKRMIEPLKQAMQRLKYTLEAAHADFPQPAQDRGLWEYLHRKNLEIWSADNYPLTPVLVFDQFEELFSRSGGNVELIKQLFDDLADLIENRIPAEVAGESAGNRRSQLDLFTQRYRIVLSFREDFLPEVRSWEKQVPSLLRSYLRLEPMSCQSAIRAVEEAGKAVLDEGIAAQIVHFVGQTDDCSAATRTSEVAIEPVLLSLCCTELNRRRARGAKIDKTLLQGAGEDILEKFYSDALEDPAVKGLPDVALFIEDKLIQGDFRGDYPRQEALDKGKVTEKQLAALTDRRLLRIVTHADTARIELIHDRLIPVIAKARDQRVLREGREQQERKAREAEAERDKERARSEELGRSLKRARRNRNIATIAAVASFIALLWAWNERQSKARVKLTAAVAVDTARLAEGRGALKPGREPLEQTMYRALAAYRLTNQAEGASQAKAASLTALHWVLENTGHLRKAVTIDNLMPTPALSYSPDGKTIAVGGEDGRIRLLDSENYRQVGTLDCHSPPHESAWSLSFSGDGERLAAGYINNSKTAHGSGLVCVFDVARRSVLKQWSGAKLWGKPADVYSVAYGGRKGQEFVVSGGTDSVVRVLDIRTQHVYESPPQKGDVVAVAVSPDGHLIAAGGDDKVLRVWNVDALRSSSPKPSNELQGHDGIIEQIEFSPADASRVVSAGDDGRIIVWNVKRACRVQQSKVQSDKIYGIAARPDGELLATAGADGNVRLFPISKTDLPCMPKTEALSPMAQAQDFDVADDGILAGHGGMVLAVAWNADGSRLASTGQEGSIRVWGPANASFSIAQLSLGTDAKRDSVVTGAVTKVAIGSDLRTIAAGDNQGFIHVWDSPAQGAEPVLENEVFPSWSSHRGAVSALAYVRVDDRTVLVSGGEDGRLKRWDVHGKPIGPDMVDGAPPIRLIAVSPDGTTLAAGSSDGVIRLWDAATGIKKKSFAKSNPQAADFELTALGFTADGKHLAEGNSSSVSVLVRDLERGGPGRILQGHTDIVNALSWGKDKWLLSAGRDGSVLEWEQSTLGRPEPEGLKKQDEFKYRMGFRNLKPLASMDVSADGKWIVSGGDAGQVQLWDGGEHVLIGASFLGHRESDIKSVAMASDASFFVTSDSWKILVWPGPDRWADLICSKLMRNMSKKQWRDWISPSIGYLKQCPALDIAPD